MAFNYLGTVSEGTMRAEDLIPAFSSVLEDLDPEAAKALAKEYEDIESAEDWDDCDPERMDFYVDALFDALGDCAPAFTYFGAHLGDGSDYGFWPDIEGAEESEDVIKVNAGDEWPLTHLYVLEVDDHGNATLYDAHTRKEVWSIV